MLKAVLWDVGGPIDEEVGCERLIDEDMKRALTEAGVTWSEADFREAARWAVDSYASNAYKAMVCASSAAGSPNRAGHPRGHPGHPAGAATQAGRGRPPWRGADKTR